MSPKLRKSAHGMRPPAGGFTLVEVMVVAGIIAIMAAVAIPNIAGFLRTYRVRGATQQIAGEIQTARNKAIMKNANTPVVFAVLDSDSYRYYIPDNNPTNLNPAPADALGPVKDLPTGVRFVAAGARGFAFDRLGRWCVLGTGQCAPTLPANQLCPPADQPRCNNWAPGTTYVTVDPVRGATVRVREVATGQIRTVSVAPGGRVMTQR